MKKHPGHENIKPPKTTGADHLKMTGRQGYNRLELAEGVLKDRNKEVAVNRKMGVEDEDLENEAFSVAKQYRELRRAHQKQIRKQWKMD